jgi:D-alanyl-D-alanine carboxypeptidase
MRRSIFSKTTLLAAGLLIFAAGGLFTGYLYSREESRNESLLKEQEKTRADLAAAEGQRGALETENMALRDALAAEQQRLKSLVEEVSGISKTVGTLEKLSRTDPELLQKYSKVYFLNEHYVPQRLAEIPSEHLFNPNGTQQIHADVWPHLKALLESAGKEDLDLKIISAYRSFGTQSSLKDRYTVQYGSGANQFSADQGYSEHQLGTALDFTTAAVGSTFIGFEETKEYSWLEENAYAYGFVLSYPEGNSYYVFEPWHWRFVGRDLAEFLHEEGKTFYDMDQRTLDTYLVTIFD